ncbi:MAG: (d)CMP kinase [Alicyclobacillaceae bacterium]|nr:(d)CMP kinase [Alicyclobacillaceae bacterium]
MRHLRIAIDGPAGAGKSTVARELARRLGIMYVDTGAMYRSVAWLAVKYGIPPSDEEAVVRLLEEHPLHFETNEQGELQVYAEGHNITAELRTPEVSNVVSQLAVHPRVRALLTDWQRAFSRMRSVVMDGRDVGTVVLPDADVKIFLTADLRERAKRREQQLRAQGFEVSAEDLCVQLADRDARDAGRDTAPLRRAHDAHQIDSTGKTVGQVVEEILSIVERVVLQ